jgi:hypothetical protein
MLEKADKTFSEKYYEYFEKYETIKYQECKNKLSRINIQRTQRLENKSVQR